MGLRLINNCLIVQIYQFSLAKGVGSVHIVFCIRGRTFLISGEGSVYGLVGSGDSIFSDGGGQQVLFWRAWEDGEFFIMTYQLHI